MPQDLIQILWFIKRRPDLTGEQFYQHWGDVHGPKVAPWAVKHGFNGYTQICTPPSMRSQWTTLFPIALPTIDFDGYATFQIESFEKFKAAFSDPYYINVIEPDAHKFLDKSDDSVVLMSTMGTQKEIVAGGKAAVDISKEMEVWREWEEKAQ